MPRAIAAFLSSLAVLAWTATAAHAQNDRGITQQLQLTQQLARGSQAPTELDRRGAEDTRQELERLMRRYPPALARVIKLDPSLMSNAAYLAPYPALASYLQQHPEIPRYPGYFFSFVYEPNNSEPRDPQSQSRAEAMRMWRDTMTGLMVFTGLAVAVVTFTWLIRYFVNHRRWLRAMKIQAEVHGRLMERFSANDELLAYVQSPAGQKFLLAAPIDVESAPSPGIAAPFARILWSVQLGVVLISAGVGMLFIKQYVIEEIGQMLLIFGTVAMSVGAGFVFAAGASYILSHRLGLFDSVRPTGTTGV